MAHARLTQQQGETYYFFYQILENVIDKEKNGSNDC